MEPQAGPRADLDDVDLLQPDAGERGVVEQPQPGAEQHRHHIDPDLVDEPGAQQLADRLRPADQSGRVLPGRYGPRPLISADGRS